METVLQSAAVGRNRQVTEQCAAVTHPVFTGGAGHDGGQQVGADLVFDAQARAVIHGYPRNVVTVLFKLGQYGLGGAVKVCGLSPGHGHEPAFHFSHGVV